MKRDAHRLGRWWAAIGALAILVAACASVPATSAPAASAPAASASASASPVPGSPAPTVPAPSAPAPSPSPSEGPAIDRLQAFIPSDVWPTCEPTVLLHFPTTVQGASCSMAGVDAVTFELYSSSADLEASFDSVVQGTRAQPSADLATACAKGNWSGTWNRTGKTIVPGNRLECDTNVSGAWMVQADPKVNVLFQVNLASGDGAALYKWWLDNVTVVEP